MKPAFFAINLMLIVSAIDCTKNPVAPPPPSPNRSDTTSHNYSFQIFSFGGGGGSILNDVTIINDTLVYAVGQIYFTDSTGQYDPQTYGFGQWDGSKWSFQKVAYHDFGITQLFPGELNSILAFGANDIFVSSPASLLHWDGSSWTEKAFFMTSLPFNGQVTKMWGTSDFNIYCVGWGGAIYHYDGNSWMKLESGTTLPIHDIWGAQNFQTGQLEILAVASDDVNKKLLKIQGTTVSTVPDSGLSASLYGVWFVPEEKYYVVGAGIGYKSSLDNSPWSVYPSGAVTSYMSGGVRGSGLNNVFVVGSFFEIVHYNGSTWHTYKDVIPFTDGAVGSMAVNGDIMVTVGLSGQNAVAIIGKRE